MEACEEQKLKMTSFENARRQPANKQRDNSALKNSIIQITMAFGLPFALIIFRATEASKIKKSSFSDALILTDFAFAYISICVAILITIINARLSSAYSIPVLFIACIEIGMAVSSDAAFLTTTLNNALMQDPIDMETVESLSVIHEYKIPGLIHWVFVNAFGVGATYIAYLVNVNIKEHDL